MIVRNLKLGLKVNPNDIIHVVSLFLSGCSDKTCSLIYSNLILADNKKMLQGWPCGESQKVQWTMGSFFIFLFIFAVSLSRIL